MSSSVELGAVGAGVVAAVVALPAMAIGGAAWLAWQSGKLLVDGLGVGDVRSAVLRDRKLLAEEGIIVIAASVDPYEKTLVSPPQIATRGFVYVKENEDLIAEIMQVAAESLMKNLDRGADLASAQTRLKEDVAKFLFNKIRRRPVIMPMLVEAE